MSESGSLDRLSGARPSQRSPGVGRPL